MVGETSGWPQKDVITVTRIELNTFYRLNNITLVGLRREFGPWKVVRREYLLELKKYCPE
uniref:Uncharacterized protein n=1 Tax=Anguilla anguilla TaxID=7936 RepID=A0A0E9R085_ANGAN